MILPLISHQTRNAFDPLRRLTQITGTTHKYFYDSANASVCPTGERSNKGRLSGFNDPSGSTRYCHNRFGDLTRKVQTSNGMPLVTAYGYDSAGRLTTTTYPDGAVAAPVPQRPGLARLRMADAALAVPARPLA